MVFNGEGCATIVLLYIYTESVKRKNEEGKEIGGGGGGGGGGGSVAQTWLVGC